MGRRGNEAGSEAMRIAWHPIGMVPEDRKNGRDVLLWVGYPAICSWCDGWRDAVGNPVCGTHYADVEGPQE